MKAARGSARGSASQKRRKAPECETCFKRRIKCDGQRPECQKCISKGLKCPGVLDEFDLKFRDQSQTVREKVERQSTIVPSSSSDRKGKKVLKHHVDAPDAQAVANEQALVRSRYARQGPAIKHSVNLPPGAFAMGLFLDGHPNMLGSSGAADPWIAYMRQAIGRQGDARPEVKTLALQRYSQCISALRVAISDPVEAAANNTLKTVLLLTIYEYVTSNDDGGKERFFHHTDGVVAVAVYRRKTGSVTYQQMQMFWVVITSMVMRYTYIGRSRSLSNRTTPKLMASPNRKVSIPKQASVREWINGLSAAHDDPGGRLFELMLGSLLLRTKSHDLHVVPAAVGHQRTEEVRAIFLAAVRMVKALDNWNATLPAAFQPAEYNAVYHLFEDDVETAEIWPGALLSFHDLQAACTYCQWRSLKIMVLCVALRNLHWLRLYENVMDHEPEFYQMRAALYEQVDGMCASVPYFIGLKEPLPLGLANSALASADLDGRGALSIAVMLQFCVLVEGIPRVQRQWIKARLKYMAEKIGIKYANVGYQNDSATLIFEGDPVLTRTFGAKESHATSNPSLSVRSSSSSPQLSVASLSTVTSTTNSGGSPEWTKYDHHEHD